MENILPTLVPITRENPAVTIYTVLHQCNCIEGCLFGIQALCSHTQNIHILIQMGNSSAVAGINKIGSSKSVNLDT